MPKNIASVAALHDAIAAVSLDTVPATMAPRSMPRKDRADLARKLFRSLGLKGISVTTPNHSMAQSVDVTLPEEPHPGWTGFEQWANATYTDMPDHVPAKARMARHGEAVSKVEAILFTAFPNHRCRSDSMTDYFDYCWTVS